MTSRRALAVGAISVSAFATFVSGCGLAAADLPLPGGGVSGQTYRLTASFTDALNLPNRADVKLDGLRVGQVTSIKATDYTAQVQFVVSQHVSLPEGTRVELRQATPLGDVFVALEPPATSGGPPLHDGDTIGLAQSASATSIEDLLATLAVLVNGGGLNQLGTIVHESNAALDGRTGTVRSLINQTDIAVGTINRHTDQIDSILHSLDVLSDLGVRRQKTIDAAFSDFAPAMATLNRLTGSIQSSLAVANKVGDGLNAFMARTNADALAMLTSLNPILAGLGQVGPILSDALRQMIDLAPLLKTATQGDALAGGGTIHLDTTAFASGTPDAASIIAIFQQALSSLPSSVGGRS